MDDLEVAQEGIGDMLLDDYRISTAARPGTSFQRPNSRNNSNQMMRPVSQSGRPLSGVYRPGSNRGTDGNNSRVFTASRDKLATGRATTSGGRQMRIATASLQSLNSSSELNSMDINTQKIVEKPALAKAVADYLYYVENDYKKVIEICAASTVKSGYNDWWWKYKLGKVYYNLGLINEAESQLLSSLKIQTNVNTVLQLSQVYVKMDQPLKSIELLKRYIEDYPGENYYSVYLARIYEMINENDQSITLYKAILRTDSCNFEALACIGSHHFYLDQPEVSLRFYRRLIEIGIQSVEVWNNMGLCCYYANQFDLALNCFEKAIAMAEDDSAAADVWFNLSHVAQGAGDLNLAYQCLKIAAAYSGDHYEAYNNLGILEIKRLKMDQARSNFALACKLSDFSFEPFYNYGALLYKQGDFEEAYKFTKKALAIFPDHFDSQELMGKLNNRLMI